MNSYTLQYYLKKQLYIEKCLFVHILVLFPMLNVLIQGLWKTKEWKVLH